MITFHDCVSCCGLTEDEIDLIAHHKKISGLSAIEFAGRMLHRRGGEQEICDILIEQVRQAEGDKQLPHLREVLNLYLKSHPRCSL